MSGNTQEQDAESKKTITPGQITQLEKSANQFYKLLKKQYPEYIVEPRETYSYDVIKGHRCKLQLILKHKTTGQEKELHRHYIKLPKNVPTWITKHNLWHHTEHEIKALAEMTKANNETNPSKKTRQQWLDYLEAEKLKNVPPPY